MLSPVATASASSGVSWESRGGDAALGGTMSAAAVGPPGISSVGHLGEWFADGRARSDQAGRQDAGRAQPGKRDPLPSDAHSRAVRPSPAASSAQYRGAEAEDALTAAGMRTVTESAWLPKDRVKLLESFPMEAAARPQMRATAAARQRKSRRPASASAAMEATRRSGWNVTDLHTAERQGRRRRPASSKPPRPSVSAQRRAVASQLVADTARRAHQLMAARDAARRSRSLVRHDRHHSSQGHVAQAEAATQRKVERRAAARPMSAPATRPHHQAGRVDRRGTDALNATSPTGTADSERSEFVPPGLRETVAFDAAVGTASATAVDNYRDSLHPEDPDDDGLPLQSTKIASQQRTTLKLALARNTEALTRLFQARMVELERNLREELVQPPPPAPPKFSIGCQAEIIDPDADSAYAEAILRDARRREAEARELLERRELEHSRSTQQMIRELHRTTSKLKVRSMNFPPLPPEIAIKPGTVRKRRMSDPAAWCGRLSARYGLARSASQTTDGAATGMADSGRAAAPTAERKPSTTKRGSRRRLPASESRMARARSRRGPSAQKLDVRPVEQRASDPVPSLVPGARRVSSRRLSVSTPRRLSTGSAGTGAKIATHDHKCRSSALLEEQRREAERHGDVEGLAAVRAVEAHVGERVPSDADDGARSISPSQEAPVSPAASPVDFRVEITNRRSDASRSSPLGHDDGNSPAIKLGHERQASSSPVGGQHGWVSKHTPPQDEHSDYSPRPRPVAIPINFEPDPFPSTEAAAGITARPSSTTSRGGRATPTFPRGSSSPRRGRTPTTSKLTRRRSSGYNSFADITEEQRNGLSVLEQTDRKLPEPRVRVPEGDGRRTWTCQICLISIPATQKKCDVCSTRHPKDPRAWDVPDNLFDDDLASGENTVEAYLRIHAELGVDPSASVLPTLADIRRVRRPRSKSWDGVLQLKRSTKTPGMQTVARRVIKKQRKEKLERLGAASKAEPKVIERIIRVEAPPKPCEKCALKDHQLESLNKRVRELEGELKDAKQDRDNMSERLQQVTEKMRKEIEEGAAARKRQDQLLRQLNAGLTMCIRLENFILASISCSLCYKTVSRPTSMPGCGHTFCRDCLLPLVEDDVIQCPTCMDDEREERLKIMGITDPAKFGKMNMPSEVRKYRASAPHPNPNVASLCARMGWWHVPLSHVRNSLRLLEKELRHSAEASETATLERHASDAEILAEFEGNPTEKVHRLSVAQVAALARQQREVKVALKEAQKALEEGKEAEKED